MAFTLDARPAEGNIYCKPNEHLRFGYPVKNLDGTPYNEPNLVDVWVTVYAHENSTVDIEKYTFLNGTSHANGTNVIAFDLVIDLPKGKYFCTIDHRRVINAVVESNVMFSGFFDVSHKNRSNCSITECMVNTTNIVNIEGLREELDEIYNDDLVLFQDFVNTTANTIAVSPDFTSLGLFVLAAYREGLTRKFNIFDLEACSIQTVKKLNSLNRRIILETRILTPRGFPFIDNLSQSGTYDLKFGIINVSQVFAVAIRIVQNQYVLIWNNGLNSFATGIVPSVEPIDIGINPEAPTNFDRLKITITGLNIEFDINGTKYNQVNTNNVDGYGSIKVETEDFLSNDFQDFGLTIDYLKIRSSR